ncbi:capsule biosynthesis GfcC family protein [Rheinheimera maricola]|uniref:Capsule biosynthesis GfcC family protein n=1 Tax=Rheinheimera maricola TaxID=2793282 RepID=A0ABS7X4A2_9GAMM|nr:capsule biosynthesis GfcC family protein [Rheinheimera maricola]MBZ9610373.1 capsule biosynthesis GfcC family protein [Rheinheimera maricola]
MRLTLAFVFAVIGLSAVTSASAETYVEINGKQHTFAQPVSLAKVLQHIEQPELVYWPGASLFLESEQVVQQKHALMATLMNQLGRLPGQSAEKAQLADFIAWLAGVRVGRRIELPIEFERARHVKRSNPLLQDQRFYLSAKAVQPELLLIAAVTQQQVDIKPGETVWLHEVRDQFASDAADNSWAYWSVSGAEWHKVGIAYWNKHPVELAAGGMLYVPFTSSVLGSDSEAINQQILLLLRNWVR